MHTRNPHLLTRDALHTMTERPVPLPESRYGRQRMAPATRRRVAIALGVLVLALGIVVAVVGYQRFEGNDVEGTIAAYQVVDDQTVSVTISVTRKNPSQPGALHRAGAIAGTARKPAGARCSSARRIRRRCRSRPP